MQKKVVKAGSTTDFAIEGSLLTAPSDYESKLPKHSKLCYNKNNFMGICHNISDCYQAFYLISLTKLPQFGGIHRPISRLRDKKHTKGGK